MSHSRASFNVYSYSCAAPEAFLEMPIMREANSASVLHRLGGGTPWDAVLGNPGVKAAGVSLLGLQGRILLLATAGAHCGGF